MAGYLMLEQTTLLEGKMLRATTLLGNKPFKFKHFALKEEKAAEALTAACPLLRLWGELSPAVTRIAADAKEMWRARAAPACAGFLSRLSNASDGFRAMLEGVGLRVRSAAFVRSSARYREFAGGS